MKLLSFMKNCYEVLKNRFFLISWISLVIYIFYETFAFYKYGRQFYHLKQILGLGLCVSRGTASVLNLCCAMVLLPLCKKLNQLLYRGLSQLCPALFFYWLERAKKFHMIVAITLVIVAVIHSIFHFANLWNFSRYYDEVHTEINFAAYRYQSPLLLLMSQAGLTGMSMLVIILSMGLTSLRVIRRKIYNVFWYTHQLYLPFLVLLLIHPLSGALKEEVLDANQTDSYNITYTNKPRFIAIKSKTWSWMTLPLSCFLLDLIWRIFSRNRARADILEVHSLAGHTVSLNMSTPHERFSCRPGQYVLLQCAEISTLEWHPFTVVKVPSSSAQDFTVWIRARGDWTEHLEKLLIENGPYNLSILVDGPLSSPLEGVSRSPVAMCVAAGVGITPYVAMLEEMSKNPRSQLPGRIHLLWIVRQEREITWLAKLLSKCMLTLRNANRPDRLHIQLYVTKSVKCEKTISNHVVRVNEKGAIVNALGKSNEYDDAKKFLLTPDSKSKGHDERGTMINRGDDIDCDIAKEYPMLGCRMRRGRPHWDRVFGYWVYLYPKEHLDLYCCGPKKLVKVLKENCKFYSNSSKTNITFVHEGFS